MNRKALLDAVPVRSHDGRSYIRIDDIPQPFRDEFRQAMVGANAPSATALNETSDLAWFVDWQIWVGRLLPNPNILFASPSERPLGLDENTAAMFDLINSFMPPDPRAPHHIARALAVKHGWRVAMPVPMAEFLLGKAPKPDELNAFPYDQPVRYEQAGLAMELADELSLFGLPPVGQALRLGMPERMSKALIAKVAGSASQGWLQNQELRGMLADLLSHRRLSQDEAALALAILAMPDTGVAQKMPVGFNPDEHENAPVVHGWRVVEVDGVPVIQADMVRHHPSVPNFRPIMTTPLVWIDREGGWARTRSRVYRLG